MESLCKSAIIEIIRGGKGALNPPRNETLLKPA